MEPFLVIFKNPLGATGYLFLILTLISVWINRRIWIWLPLLGISFAFAYFGGIVELKALVPIGILFLCHAMLTKEIGSFWRLFTVMIAAVISFGFLTHYIVGFDNIRLVSSWGSSTNAVPMNIYMNYDKPLIAIFVLGLYLPLLRNKDAFIKMLMITIPWCALTAFVVLGLGLYLNCILFAFKVPSITLAWLIVQLFFVVIPEEVFFRGFLQREIAQDLHNRVSGLLAVLVVSLLVGLVHLLMIPNTCFFLGAFITSLFYGGIYLITGSIESAIITHYFFNIIHFFFFTYPLLKCTL